MPCFKYFVAATYSGGGGGEEARRQQADSSNFRTAAARPVRVRGPWADPVVAAGRRRQAYFRGPVAASRWRPRKANGVGSVAAGRLAASRGKAARAGLSAGRRDRDRDRRCDHRDSLVNHADPC